MEKLVDIVAFIHQEILEEFGLTGMSFRQQSQWVSFVQNISFII